MEKKEKKDFFPIEKMTTQNYKRSEVWLQGLNNREKMEMKR